MPPFWLLGILAVVIGIIGMIGLMKGKKYKTCNGDFLCAHLRAIGRRFDRGTVNYRARHRGVSAITVEAAMNNAG